MQLSLNEVEREFLEGLLAASLGEIREEVYHAEEHHFKDDLKQDEAVLRALLGRVRHLAEVPVTI